MSAIFPKWMNLFPTVSAIGGLLGLTGVVGGFWYYATPKFWNVGYMPVQPGPAGFNHQIHAGKLGMDCRYCHTKVEKSYEANIPNVATCNGCHAEDRITLYTTSEVHKERTNFIREAYAADASIPWRRVHKVPDYVHNFPHQAHLAAGVSCFSCHGRIDTMPVVYQSQPLSMSWCLDCHRNPEQNLVPKDQVTNLNWVEAQLAERANGAASAVAAGKTLVDALKNSPPQNCGACHY
ncbi:Menaquinone reductase, multiheme cytochrome c subunit [Phycisphaerales bacterium]|nr:Menaquinone reductase, multiheme cytochrome c subunit [Phycisphaerales bacterium]